MKKGLVVLAVLVMASPLYAGTITFDPCDLEDGTCDLNWTSDVAIVAIGLDINGSDPCVPITIDSVDSFFEIFMDLAYDMETDPCTSYGYGDGNGTADNARAKQSEAGQQTTPSNAFCISMGGLGGETDPCEFPPPSSGKIVLSASANTSGTISKNGLRGGVIDDTGAEVTLAGTLSFTITAEDCMQAAGIDASDPCRYAAFLEAGKPECWCEPQQCHANADNTDEGTAKTGYYAVGTPDLAILLAGWGIIGTGINGVVEPVSGVLAACANFDNDAVVDPLVPGSGTFIGGREGTAKTGYYQVGTGDLGILLAYWGLLNPGTPGDCEPRNR